MKVGDLVKHALAHKRENMLGVIINKTHERVFCVLWRDGSIGKNVWDYDLEMISEGG
jgi:hypothetical protein